MSETEIIELKKGKIRRLLILVLMLIGIGSIITVLFIFYMNVGNNTGDNTGG